ncbi:MAG: ABC transporter permease [Candidatus Faecousia sp.]|nr:ABC transporter permease [Clostridiales bacterium]MDY6179779.1 ABC transporter permease [Candidatus Faecousia sp.]
MKMGLYPKLAWDGIRKNRRLYIPYLLTCGGMMMMFYIIHYLAAMEALNGMSGGRTVGQMLGMGVWIVALFALIFLLYTNSFLMRRRQKEFGLYNILGMGKGNLSLVLLWENLLAFVISMAGGLAGGIALSKLAELGLVRVLGGWTGYSFSVNWEAVQDTLLVFGGIFCLIFLKNLIQIRRLSPVALLKRESAGEKPPKANYLLGLGGVLLLGWAYYIAVSIQSPLAALGWFFIAVGMVIVATYLIFISGSVMLCRILQKNSRYYYRKNHFVSVSSMAYRMKRNGAGLASICILSTMVLVMMLGCGSLYFGAEDSLLARYPREINMTAYLVGDDDDAVYSDEDAWALLQEVQDVAGQYGAAPENAQHYISVRATGLLRDGKLTLNYQDVDSFGEEMNWVCQVYFLSLEDYNRCMGTSETLEVDEALIHCVRRSYQDPTITTANGTTWRIKKQVREIVGSGDASMDVIPSVFLVVSDLNRAMDAVNEELAEIGKEYLTHPLLAYGFDTGLPAEDQVALCDAIRMELYERQGGFYPKFVECREEERSDFYGTYGGIFFLGLLLSLVFLLATALIIYYKQVTEGYEDESRYGIMRKVGMTREDIRKSVNSQMLTVFILPIATAALHLGFAFPMVSRLLMLFNLRNVVLMLTVAAVTVLVFGLFYALVYKLTANAYYSIVSGRKDG